MFHLINLEERELLTWRAMISQAIADSPRTVGKQVENGQYQNQGAKEVVKSDIPSRVFTDSKVLFFVFEFLDTGTAVTFFFTRNTDLFFAKALLSARRNLFGGDRDRRVLTFPSGLGLLGFDLNLFVGFCFGNGLGMGFGFPICRWEDAKGNGDASLKVQICDF
ncbi:hypothetical protein FOXG_18464 [Fusarium oxysporum f. sp. lycopersici 4287]|uniref:Uncharacterized protein n=2 Tax=Fusarium oxysporum TaxID=5507 RepID=A0A0J9UHB6_FUSO4|nr:hypothetical protein FOXG_18464 [Fusarium oxysporum f. sp. lycopersici 4287]EXK34002.1 hypothetical protein FOMG_11163 [Fusarium oxysporum f. sp. melonis 26406]EXK34003.1 hypothetical protein FOMG_11163 [Fusarium oxysporum f. sp. melonis 26406]EXK34004.1 hypothetical protein FOMG_11163 [Fusarium oxysporum f. sp. melonis 26406]KNA98813.1 hypothetical protein FOXG_18464 [Fusarium oxysporum f. sp. lycopersici 4287]